MHASDVSARDNEGLARAGKEIRNTAMGLFRTGMIDKEEVLRLVYKCLGEEIDVEEMGERTEEEILRKDAKKVEKDKEKP